MRAATWSVGLVSPRSTCESIGAETPQRSARSRSDHPPASRSARTRGPTRAMAPSDIRPYAITYNAACDYPRVKLTSSSRSLPPDTLTASTGPTPRA